MFGELGQLIFNGPQGPVLDQSVQILGQIFGTSATDGISNLTAQVFGAPTSVSLFSQIVGYFDIAAFGVVTVIFSYMVIIATVNTAHEGTAFGRQHHTTYTMVRTIIGPTLMFPIPAGVKGAFAFSLLQKFMMHFVLVGILLANAVWHYSVGKSMGTPPTQLPGPVKNLVAEQVGKVYVYDAVYKMMGLNKLDSTAKLTVNQDTQEYGPADAQLYNYMMGKFSDNCATDNHFISYLGGLDTANPQVNNVSTQCMTAVNKMKELQSPSMLYPLAAGRNINSNTDISPSDVLPSKSTSTNPTDDITGNANSVSKYVQFHMHFGTNAPYYNNGMFDIPAGAYYEIQGFKTQEQSGTKPPAGVPAGPTNVAQALSQSTDLNNLIVNLNPNPTGNSGSGPQADALLTAQPLSPWTMSSTPPDLVSCAWGSSTQNTCNFGPLIDQYTNSLINDQAAAAEAKGLANAIVPGTGDTCKATWRNEKTGQPADRPANASVDPVPVEVPADSTQRQDTTVYTKQCYRKHTTYVNGQNPVSSYVYINGQNFSNSWWYGSEVYLSINQQLANNIKDITKEIGRFSIVSNALSLSSMVGTKTTHVVDTADLREDWGHTLQNSYDLWGSESTGSHARQDNAVTIKYGPGGTFTSSQVALPDWKDMYCIFDPNGSGFLNSSNAACSLGAEAAKAFPTNSGVLTQSGDNSKVGNEQLFNDLKNLPPSFQNPVKLLLYWEINVNLSNVIKKNPGNADQAVVQNVQGLVNSLKNIIRVLKVNHMYPGSQAPEPGVDTSGEVDPAKAVITTMFNKILGANPTGQMNDPNMGNVYGGLMQEIYSLGNSDITPAAGTDQSEISSVLANSFNNVAKAQQIGVHMINVVIFGIEGVYEHIKSVSEGYMSQDHDIYESIKTKAIAAGAAGAAGGIAGAFMPGAAAAGSAIEQGVSMWAMVDQIQLQNNMVKQSFSLTSMMMWFPLIITTSIALFTAGVSFAILIPLMPFLLFWAGQISWLLSVIEAIIAAPLICLAWTTPGGHQHFGHVLGGVKILIGIVFRPVLMVLGLFAAMILTYVLIKFSSQAFQIVAEQVLSYANMAPENTASYLSNMGTAYANNASTVQGILAVLMLLMYCSLMVMAFNKCYSTIYMIPEKVLGWIGVQVDKVGAQDAEKLSGAVQQSAGQAGQAGGQALTQGGQAQSSHASQSAQADSSNAGTSLQMGSKGSQAGQAANSGAKDVRDRQKGSTGKQDGPGADGGK